MNVSGSFWTRKYRQHIAAMIGVCYRYVPDRETAEDLAHDAFLRAMESVDKLKVSESFDHWLTRITVNTAVTYLREKARMPIDRQEGMPEELPDLDDDISPENMLEAIRQANFTQKEIVEAIALLPEHHRTVLNLYVFEKRTHRQIAELLGISANTSKSHLMRARKELQIILFQKSKHKKALLMTHIIPLFSIDAAFDRYCRRQMAGLELSPQRPIPTADIHSAATVELPLRMRYHALRAPLAAGIGAAAVGAMLIPAVQQQPQPTAPMSQPPTTSVVTEVFPSTDSTAATESSVIQTETTDKQPVNTASKQKTQEKQEAQEAQEIIVNTKDPPDTAAAAPVIVKKVMRHSKHTVIIKDSNKR